MTEKKSAEPQPQAVPEAAAPEQTPNLPATLEKQPEPPSGHRPTPGWAAGWPFWKSYLLEEEMAAVETLQRRVQDLDALAGDEKRFTATTAKVLHKALREARVDNPRRIANAIAPSIAQSIKAEIRNSKDEMVEALTPIVGRLVAAAVKDAVAEMDAKIQRAMPFDRWLAAMQARIIGGSAAVRLLAEKDFAILEALAIDRASGALLAHQQSAAPYIAPGAAQTPPDLQRMSALLTAIASFAENELARDGGLALRRLTHDDGCILLRATPATILALRCSGLPPAALEPKLESAFDAIVERVTHIRFDTPPDEADREAFAEPLIELAEKSQSAHASEKRGASPVLVALGAAGLAALLWIAASYTANTRIDSQENALYNAALSDPRLQGYPLSVTYDHAQESFVLIALAPDAKTAAQLRARVTQAAQDAQAKTQFQIGVIPSARPAQ